MECVETLRSLPGFEGKAAPTKACGTSEQIDRYMKSVRSSVAALR